MAACFRRSAVSGSLSEGAAYRALMNSIAFAASVGLQYRVQAVAIDLLRRTQALDHTQSRNVRRGA
jgi:hypothetical protein